jgi:hypothetical protein
MIVRRAGDFLHLITQPDHAALAGRIMRQWQPLFDAERRGSILHAIEEHDNGWREADEAPTVDPASGRIHDFITAPVGVRQGVWPRGVARLVDDPWAAALVAQHAITVYDRYRSDPDWVVFFRDLAMARDEMIAQTGLAFEQLTRDYDFVRIGDLISLIFCNLWDEESYGVWTFRRNGDRVTITPDAFNGRELPVAVVACEIADRRYESNSALAAAVRAGSAKTITGLVGGR